MAKLIAVPVTLKKANDFVSAWHRHNGRTSRDGGKFAIGVSIGAELLGVAIVGNPLSATYMDGYTAEVLRVCVSPAAPKGTCSFLYSRCWQAYRAMGGLCLITYTLTTESGASLRGAGWKDHHLTKPKHTDWEAKGRMTGKARKQQEIYGQQKICWFAGRAPNTNSSGREDRAAE